MYLKDKKVRSSFDGLPFFYVLGAYVPPINDMTWGLPKRRMFCYMSTSIFIGIGHGSL